MLVFASTVPDASEDLAVAADMSESLPDVTGFCATRIIVGNTAVAGAQTEGCTLVRVVTGGTDGMSGAFAGSPQFKSYDDYHLVSGAAPNALCCVDKGQDLGAALFNDVDNNHRPKGAGFEIGAPKVE